MKAVLWVSADGLRVVDDKTKVRKEMVCVCHLCPSLSPCSVLSFVFPPLSSSSVTVKRGQEAVYSLQHAGVSSVLSSFSPPPAHKDFAAQNKTSPHIHLCRTFFVYFHIFFRQTNKRVVLSQFDDAASGLTSEGSTLQDRLLPQCLPTLGLYVCVCAFALQS